MARRGPNGKCAICKHVERGRIEFMCAAGVGRRAIAKKFDVPADSVYRHWSNHVESTLKQRYVAGRLASLSALQGAMVDESGSILDNLRIVRSNLYAVFSAAAVADDRNAVSLLAGKLHENLQLAAKLSGQFLEHGAGTVTNNIFLSPNYLQLRADLLRVLRRHPAAAAEVAQLFRRQEQAAIEASPQIVNGEQAAHA